MNGDHEPKSVYLPGEDDEIREAGRLFAAAIHDIDRRECGGSGVWELYSDDLDVEIERLKAQIEHIENAIYETRNLIREVTWRAYNRAYIQQQKQEARTGRSINTGGDLR